MAGRQIEHHRARFGFRRIALLVILVVVIAVPVVGWRIIWRSPPYFTETIPAIEWPEAIMTNAEYGEVIDTHARPYVVSIEHASSNGALLLFGAEHTRNPHDPQLDRVRSEWQQLRPTIALVEGRLGFLIQGFMDPVENLGEGGLVNALARADDVPVYNWDLRKEDLTRMLVVDYPKERVALLMVLNPYFSNLRFGKPDNPDAFVEPYRQTRTQYPGLEGALPSMEAIDRMWQRDFPNAPDWRDTSDEYDLPGYLQEISERARDGRDEHLVQLIVHLVKRGERVFVIAGSSHAVRLEPALGSVLE